MFQSLFSWMSLWNLVLIIATSRSSDVSILVLVDVALERERSGGYHLCHDLVSILVLVDVALEQP